MLTAETFTCNDRKGFQGLYTSLIGQFIIKFSDWSNGKENSKQSVVVNGCGQSHRVQIGRSS